VQVWRINLLCFAAAAFYRNRVLMAEGGIAVFDMMVLVVLIVMVIVGCRPACHKRAFAPSGRLSVVSYYLAFISFTASTSLGSTFMASPTIPYCAASNIGASLSVLTATIYLDELMPARCWVAPEIPTAR
jgi:hypothetical protein